MQGIFCLLQEKKVRMRQKGRREIKGDDRCTQLCACYNKTVFFCNGTHVNIDWKHFESPLTAPTIINSSKDGSCQPINSN